MMCKWEKYQDKFNLLKQAECAASTRVGTGGAETSYNTIWLDTHLRGKSRLEVTVHELMHLLYPNESEENVGHAGKLISRIL